MKFTMSKLLSSIALAAAAMAPVAAHAGSMIGQTVADELVVKAGGFEWVYAGPCAGLQPSCGTVTLSQGFDFATDAQWNASFSSITDLLAKFDGKCAAAYFNNGYDHCDFNDAEQGYVWKSPLAPNDDWYRLNSAAETFLVREASNDVPEPASFALIGLGLAAASLARRKQRG